MIAVAEKSNVPKLSPLTVNEEPPDVARLIEEAEMEAASNENRVSPVPTMPMTVMTSVPKLLAADA